MVSSLLPFSAVRFADTLRVHPKISTNNKFYEKLKCEMIAKCVAYTFEQSERKCILHSSIENGQKYARGKQTGSKKPDYILPLLEISYCSETNRKRRCRSEPKCNHVDCLRNAPDNQLDSSD